MCDRFRTNYGILPEMALVLALALAATLAASIWVARRALACGWLEALATGATASLAFIGSVATALGVADGLNALALTIALLTGSAIAIALALRRTSPTTRAAATPRWRAALILVGLLLGLGLRLPTLPAALAGRDQGTYALRAEHSARTGSFDFVDPVLARLGPDERAGAADVRGLYPKAREPWRLEHYESPYRPGFYLAQRDTGHVVPQFFHLYPALLAVFMMVGGQLGLAIGIVVCALATLSAWAALADRLWPRGPWAPLALAFLAVAPSLIWTQRLPLTEGLTAAFAALALGGALRARDGDGRGAWVAAIAIGAAAFTRGNAILAAPPLLAVLWLRPEGRARWAATGLLVCVLGSATLHATTAFPYLHDEIARLRGGMPVGPELIVFTAVAAASMWLFVDHELRRRLRREPTTATWILRAAPYGLLGSVVGLAALYLWLRAGAPAKPYSRLDGLLALVDPVGAVLAAVGLGALVRRWRPTRHDAWLVAIAGMVLFTAALYTRRNLPSGALYYYGRYLVPWLLPAFVFFAIEGLRVLASGVGASATKKKIGLGLCIALGGTFAWGHAGVLVMSAQTRMQEFASAKQAVDALVEALPPGAVVIAGGEGWHHGHTYNQVGGALALRADVTVLPYRSREAAYATMFELLVAGPAATGESAPPLYLLVNEASHNYTREDGTKVAGVDLALPPPFAGEELVLAELFVDSLTPSTEDVPTRITRHQLRMALAKISVDGERAGLEIGKAEWTAAPLCLSAKTDTTIDLPEHLEGAGSVVLLAAPGTERENYAWKLKLDDDVVALDAPGIDPRPRDTIGPLVTASPPKRLLVRGSNVKVAGAACPHGGLAGVRWLPADRQTLHDTPLRWARTFAAGDPEHPAHPTVWVAASAVSRYRPGTEPTPQIKALSMVLGEQTKLAFARTWAPVPEASEPREVDVVVTLTGSRTNPDARIVLKLDGARVEEIDPPDDLGHAWPTRPIRTKVEGPTTKIELLLEGGDEHTRIYVRDVALFDVGDQVESSLLP